METPGTGSGTSREAVRYLRFAGIAAAPCLAAGVYRYGLRVVVMVAVAWAVAAAVEYGSDALRRRKTPKTFLAVGLLYVLILPPGTPIWMVALGMAFAMVLGKEVFGGTGHHLFSLPLLGRCFLTLSYPAAMMNAYVACGEDWLDLSCAHLTRLTPLVLARQGEATPVMKLILGGAPGCIGETVGAVVVAGGIFLLIVRAIDWRVVVGTLGSFFVCELLLRPFPGGAALPVGWQVLAGGVLFGTFFLAGDPVTSPRGGLGRLAFGALVGTMAMLLRRFGTSPDDVAVAILLGNMLTPWLKDRFTARSVAET